MKRINLRDFYPFYLHDCYIEVDDNIAAFFKAFTQQEEAYRMRTYRHKAYYSLDRDEGIERDIMLVPLSPYEVYERKLTRCELYEAINTLPDKQAKRIYVHFFLNMSKYAISRIEGVDESSIRKSIERGLRRMEKLLRNRKLF